MISTIALERPTMEGLSNLSAITSTVEEFSQKKKKHDFLSSMGWNWDQKVFNLIAIFSFSVNSDLLCI